MSLDDLTRRDFGKLSLAALGGALAGAMLPGCTPGKDGDTGKAGDGTAASADVLLDEPHVCRGLNACKGTDSAKGNACGGQGKCATAKAHSCKGQNECKGQGGCGENPGANACTGKGECAVPLNDEAWAKARKNFEAAMTKAGKTAGSAPAKA
ncbi:MAG TPA: hypothetical protein VMT52_18620 [Planctomycetota bacterium]|nr:hypothetical protein [Planctomycetota bacterium]